MKEPTRLRWPIDNPLTNKPVFVVREDAYEATALFLRKRVLELEAEIESLRSRLAEAERDAERLDWIGANLIEGKWDGTIGRPKSWHMVGPYRHTLQSMRGNTLREAIDAYLSRADDPETEPECPRHPKSCDGSCAECIAYSAPSLSRKEGESHE